MSVRANVRVASTLLILGLSLAACNAPQAIPDALQESSQGWDPCAGTPALALDVEAAASAPALISPDGAPSLGALGQQGAQALADQIKPQGTFCDAELPAAFQSIIEQAQQLTDQGDKAGARMLLESLLELGSHPDGGFLMSVRLQIPQQARSYIMGYMTAAGIYQSLGGDGQAFIDQANATFNEMANAELNSASFDETMRLMEEAQLLGLDDIAQRALKRARDIAAEGLDATIEDFDPCLSNPDDLKQAITKLLVALQTAMVLGEVPGTTGPGGARYDATWSQAAAAIKTLMGETPDECKGYTFNFNRTVSGSVTMTGEAHTCGGIRGPWEGTLHLAGTWTDFGNTGQGNGILAFTVPEDSDDVETIIPTSGQINADEGCYMPYNDPLQLRVLLTGKTKLELGIISTNAGTASIVCPGGTEALPSIMTVWTEEPTFTVELEHGAECP